MKTCFGCGIPITNEIRCRIKFPAENKFRKASIRAESFCSEACAYCVMFDLLPKEVSRDSITRFLAGKPITLAQYKEKVQLDRYEIPSEDVDSKDRKIANSRK